VPVQPAQLLQCPSTPGKKVNCHICAAPYHGAGDQGIFGKQNYYPLWLDFLHKTY
jgi:hypothetical protein